MKNMFITGGASGIGKETAKLFASKGYYIGVVDLNFEGAQETAKEIGNDKAMAIKCDVSKKEEVEKALALFASKNDGVIDIVHSNAGILFVGLFETLDLGKADLLINVNARSTVYMAHYALPYLKKSKEACFLTTSSASAILGLPTYNIYGATKAFDSSLIEALHMEFKPYGIYVADIQPEIVKTNMTTGDLDNYAEGTAPKNIQLTPLDVAKKVEEAITKKDRIHWLVGETAVALDQIQKSSKPTDLIETIEALVKSA